MSAHRTLWGMWTRSLDEHGSSPLFGSKVGTEWRWMSYRQFGTEVDALRSGFAAAGVTRGDRIALISDNSAAWAATAYACFSLGAAVVPMYEAQSRRDWGYITRDSGAKLLLCASKDIYERTVFLHDECPALEQRLAVGLPANHHDAYAKVLAIGRAAPVLAEEPQPTDTASIIYTSGTTGDPKGVVLSHHNLCSNVSAVTAAIPLTTHDRSLSFLPWAHSFGQTCELHSMIALGASVALAESIPKLLKNVIEVRPTVLISVPRIFNTIFNGVRAQMSHRPEMIQRLFEQGMQLKREQRERKLKLTERAMLEASERLVFSAIRQKFGGKLRYAFSGGAALSTEVAQFIDDLGITVYEGYGLTEAGPVVSCNRPGARRIGSVGKVLDGVRVAIDLAETDDPDDGEIVVYGSSVMSGYHERPSETAAAFTDDGGLRTGDIGRIDADGFLYITGRIKEQYKLQSGKYVVPAPLEERIKLTPYINNVMVHGEGRDYNVALVVVNLDALHRWADDRSLSFNDTAALLASERVRQHILAEIGERSQSFRRHERIKAVALIDEDFSTHNHMLTPTLKIKRDAVLSKYRSKIDALYA